MTLEMPTPETLTEEAAALEALAAKKEKQSAHPELSDTSRDYLLKDAGIFREEAASKRAKAQRLIKKDIEAGVRTPSGTLVSTIESMHAKRQRHWEAYLRGEVSDFS